MGIRGRYPHLLFSIMFLLWCGMVFGCSSTQEPDSSAWQITPVEQSGTTSRADPQQPADMSATDVVSQVFYHLPQTVLTSPASLYVSPTRVETISPVEIPAGERVSVMGRNPSSSHLRVAWNTGIGWLFVSSTDYQDQQQQVEQLTEFRHEPPACAVPLTTQFSTNAEWTSDQRQRIVIVVDIFRSSFGTAPPSSLLLTVNGVPIESSQQPIVERGHFPLKYTPFFLPGFIQAGDIVGYKLETTSDEPLTFIATIFRVPENCPWNYVKQNP